MDEEGKCEICKLDNNLVEEWFCERCNILIPRAELEALKREYFEAGVWAMGNNNDSGCDVQKEFERYEQTKVKK